MVADPPKIPDDEIFEGEGLLLLRERDREGPDIAVVLVVVKNRPFRMSFQGNVALNGESVIPDR